MDRSLALSLTAGWCRWSSSTPLDRPDLEELVRLHTHLSPGDVTYRWAQVDRNEDQVALALRFIRPIETRAIMVFSIEHEGIIVDTALSG